MLSEAGCWTRWACVCSSKESLDVPIHAGFFVPLSTADADKKLSAEEEEARRIAEMGKPILGDNCRLEVIIEESYDFKVRRAAYVISLGLNPHTKRHRRDVVLHGGKAGLPDASLGTPESPGWLGQRTPLQAQSCCLQSQSQETWLVETLILCLSIAPLSRTLWTSSSRRRTWRW